MRASLSSGLTHLTPFPGWMLVYDMQKEDVDHWELLMNIVIILY